MKKILATVLTKVLLLFSMVNVSEAVTYYGQTVGYVTESSYPSEFAESWPEVGAEVYFNYWYTPSETNEGYSFGFDISIPSFSDVHFYEEKSQAFHINFYGVSYDASTKKFDYFDVYNMPDEWLQWNDSVDNYQHVHDQWLILDGFLGGEWTGEIQYWGYVEVFSPDYRNEDVQGIISFTTKPVPEPASMVPFGMGFVGLVSMKIRKFRTVSSGMKMC